MNQASVQTATSGAGTAPPPPEEAPRERQSLERGALLLAGAAAVFPIIFAAVRAVARGWYPTGDNGMDVIRALDVFGSNPPLLGTWASASLYTNNTINHPGPLLFYLLAIPVKVLGNAAGIAIGMALLNSLAVVGVVWFAVRRGGRRFGIAAALLSATLAWSIGSEILYDPWAVYAPLFPFLLLLTASWSAADGDAVALPVVALSASIVAQTHLSYILLAPVLCLWALVGFITAPRRLRRRGARPGEAKQYKRGWLWLAGAIVLLALAWLPPLYEQFTSNPGNLSALIKASGAKAPKAAGFHGALQATGAVVTLPPWWLPPSFGHPTFHRYGDGHPQWLVIASIVVLTAVAVWLIVLAVRRHDRAAWTALVTAILATIVAIITSTRSTIPFGLLPAYIRWFWPLSVFVWLALGFGAVRAVAASRWWHERRHTNLAAPSYATLGAVAATVLVAVLTIPTVNNGAASPTWAIPASKALYRQGRSALLDGRTYLVVNGGSTAAWALFPPVISMLQRDGFKFVVQDDLTPQYGGNRRCVLHNADAELIIGGGAEAIHPPPGQRRVAFYTSLSPAQEQELAGLRATLRGRIAAAGGLHLSPYGKKLQAEHRLGKDAVTTLRQSTTDPDYPLVGDRIQLLAGFHLIDTHQLGQADLDRFIHLQLMRVNETAGLLITKAPTCPRPAGPSANRS